MTDDVTNQMVETKELLPEPSQIEEDFNISPEHLEFAKTYLQTLSLEQTATYLGIPIEDATKMYRHKDVKTLIDTAFMESGYMNRHKLVNLMEKIIDSKLEEAQESEIYTDKDLVDLLEKMHKMRMDEMKAQSKLMELEIQKNKKESPRTAVQVNNNTTNYGSLVDRILEGEK